MFGMGHRNKTTPILGCNVCASFFCYNYIYNSYCSGCIVCVMRQKLITVKHLRILALMVDFTLVNRYFDKEFRTFFCFILVLVGPDTYTYARSHTLENRYFLCSLVIHKLLISLSLSLSLSHL